MILLSKPVFMLGLNCNEFQLSSSSHIFSLLTKPLLMVTLQISRARSEESVIRTPVHA